MSMHSSKGERGLAAMSPWIRPMASIMPSMMVWKSLEEQPAWVPNLVWASIVGGIASILSTRRVLDYALMSPLVDDVIKVLLRDQTVSILIAGTVIIPVGWMLRWLMVALFFYVVGLLVNQPFRFATVFSAAAHASSVQIIVGMPLHALLMWWLPVSEVPMISFSPAVFLPQSHYGSVLYQSLLSFNVFDVWGLLLFTLSLAHIYQVPRRAMYGAGAIYFGMGLSLRLLWLLGR